MIKVISGGLYTSVQDLGRFGQREFGVPLAGAMDSYSARLANRLVGNSSDAAILEITHIGPVLHFTDKTEIAITGAGFSPTLNDDEIPLNTRILVQGDSTLKFGLPGYGMRAYLAISGGFSSEMSMGSYSQYQGITLKDTIENGDILMVQSFEKKTERVTASVKVSRERFTSEKLEVYKGPDFHLLSKYLQKSLLESALAVSSESNRMAYFLKGWEDFSANEIVTAPVQPGTVQLTPSGQGIVLMRDAQTTGGYARVLQLTEKSINRLAQKLANAAVKFKLVE